MITAQNISIQIGPQTLLEQLSFAIAAGERVAVVGHNGAGKSTLLRALSGFSKVSQGQLHVHGTPLHQAHSPKNLRQLRVNVAHVHQGLHLVDRASVLSNVLIGGAARQPFWGYWSRSEKHQAHGCLERVGMHWASARRTDSLSGGERQKVAIARALNQNAPLMLADEPTASLDHKATIEAMQLLVDVVRERQNTLLCVVHDLNLLPQIAQRALVLRQGRLVADVSVDTQTPLALREFFNPDFPLGRSFLGEQLASELTRDGKRPMPIGIDEELRDKSLPDVGQKPRRAGLAISGALLSRTARSNGKSGLK